MIYEGAVIRRLVTPSHPGDPSLDDPNAEIQCRVEYVKDNANAPAPGSWTRQISEAHVYPRHLDADIRAKTISPHCFARVIARETETDLSGGVESRHALDKQRIGSANENLASGGSIPPDLAGLSQYSGSNAPPAQNNLPAAQDVPRPRVGVEVCSAGKHLKRKPGRSRLAALRLAQERGQTRESQPSDRAWWRQGQYA